MAELKRLLFGPDTQDRTVAAIRKGDGSWLGVLVWPWKAKVEFTQICAKLKVDMCYSAEDSVRALFGLDETSPMSVIAELQERLPHMGLRLPEFRYNVWGYPLSNAELIIDGTPEGVIIGHNQHFPEVSAFDVVAAKTLLNTCSLRHYMQRLQDWEGCATICTNGRIIGVQFRLGVASTDNLPVVFDQLASLYSA